jgi:hypothetical protein
MLREKNIPPFSTWEKELPKLAFDPRFKRNVTINKLSYFQSFLM